ncbi:MAG: signal peptide peptidase SppA [Deltaproteobacteria bacterium]|nr:MAG: signal peptide peptidase SppA [Deltaproteobacteria bacterium]
MRRRNRRRIFLFSGMLAVIFSFIVTTGCAFVNISLYRRAQPLEEKVIEGEGPGKVLLMDISGVLRYEEKERLGSFKEPINIVARIKEELDKAAKDSEVKAVVLRINSPGGTVSASDLLHHELEQFKRQRKVKMVACFLGLATSGGYYVATAADHIVAQPTSLTGSIGTIAFKFNVQGLMDKVGVEEETIKSGDKKDIWSPFRPATTEERKILQELIEDYQLEFLKVVRAGRRELTEDDLAILSDGRVFTGTQALKLNLVDELGYLSDAVEWARKAAGVPQAKVVAYHRPGTYVDNIYSLSQGEVWGWMERIQQGAVLADGPTPQFMYLWTP